MGKLFAEGQQLEEELKQIVDLTQGGSLARFRMSKKRHTGCDVDVCMMITHVLLLKNMFPACFFVLSHFLSLYIYIFTVSFFYFLRRLSSFVWRGCRLMNSYDRLPRVTDQLTEKEENEVEAIITMPMRLHRPFMSLAPTTAVGVDVEATATALDTVEVS